MTGVLTLFGETDIQDMLKREFEKNDMYFICRNCKTSVQLLSRLEESGNAAEAAVIYSRAVNMLSFTDLIDEIYKSAPDIKIILILSGSPADYLRNRIKEYKRLVSGILFEDSGFSAEELVKHIKNGYIPHREQPVRRNRPGFSDYDDRQGEYMLNNENSFLDFSGHYVIGVFNAAHGAGSTTAAVNMARYFAVQNFSTAIADFSGTDALKNIKYKNITIVSAMADLSLLREQFNITIVDFGTPYDISADGSRFKLEQTYPADNIRLIKECDIKLIFGFADIWNIGKIQFFCENEAWQQEIDTSYIFVILGNSDKVKRKYPHINIYNRDADYKEDILEVLGGELNN